MPQKLVKHGTRAGYEAERLTGNICDRCRAAKRVYDSQYTKANRAKGVKYRSDQVIDHLDKSGSNRQAKATTRQRPADGETVTPVSRPSGEPTHAYGTAETDPPTARTEPAGPSLADKVSDGLRKLVGNRAENDYVSEDEPPDYLHAVDPDPEPDEDWEGPADEEFIINKAGMVLIEDNLGTYLSVLGITLEMIDPYCGPILAENFDNIVNRWTKVIARYPKAAKLFMSKDGGTLFTWIGAIQATWPVLLAIYRHHLSKEIQTDKEGRVFRVNSPQNNNGHVDATMPPQFNYTVD
jgi:hypothetical protein